MNQLKGIQSNTLLHRNDKNDTLLTITVSRTE